MPLADIPNAIGALVMMTAPIGFGLGFLIATLWAALANNRSLLWSVGLVLNFPILVFLLRCLVGPHPPTSAFDQGLGVLALYVGGLGIGWLFGIAFGLFIRFGVSREVMQSS